MKEYTVKWIKWLDNREENLGKVKEIADLQIRLQELEKDEAWKRLVTIFFFFQTNVQKYNSPFFKSILDVVLVVTGRSKKLMDVI